MGMELRPFSPVHPLPQVPFARRDAGGSSGYSGRAHSPSHSPGRLFVQALPGYVGKCPAKLPFLQRGYCRYTKDFPSGRIFWYHLSRAGYGHHLPPYGNHMISTGCKVCSQCLILGFFQKNPNCGTNFKCKNL